VRFGVEAAYFPFYLRFTYGVNCLQACIFILLDLLAGVGVRLLDNTRHRVRGKRGILVLLWLLHHWGYLREGEDTAACASTMRARVYVVSISTIQTFICLDHIEVFEI
jgi:hypothetical protein